MKFRTIGSITPAVMILITAIFACNLGTPRPASQATSTIAAVPTNTVAVVEEVATELGVTATIPATVAVRHQITPANLAVLSKLVYDVASVDTAPDKRAPYGDSYFINRLERPFLQDMTYVPNLDISSFKVGRDGGWYYVSIALVGTDPNDKLGIDYAVELDTDHDGFGDYIIWAHPPYPADWDTLPVQIFRDSNHDTGGRSAEKSDAPLTTDGYDTLIFNGGITDSDTDVAWVRIGSGPQGSLQVAFKRSWSGDIFMLGVLADAGLKDPKKLDYVDRFTLAQAGSPVRANENYPLKALYAIDTVCREAFGFKAGGYEPQLCPPAEPPPTKQSKPTATP